MLVNIKVDCKVTFRSINPGETFIFDGGGVSAAECLFIKCKMQGSAYCDYGTRLYDGTIASFSADADVTPISLKVVNV